MNLAPPLVISEEALREGLQVIEEAIRRRYFHGVNNYVPSPPAPLPERERERLEVVIVGGGMITHDQILPSIYHLQRLGLVGAIRVCA